MIGKNKKIKVLITGANGFIGSNLTGRLLRENFDITIIIGQSGLKYLEPIDNKKIRIFSWQEIENDLKKIGGFNFVFNLCGYGNIVESFDVPLKYEMNKPIPTIKLIENCRPGKFINISTANVYDFSCNPLNENARIQPLSPYAISQLTADYYTMTLCPYYKIPYLVLRLFNPYGPPNKHKGVIANIINMLLNRRRVTLYNPRRRFDFTYIDDIIEAIFFCAPKRTGIINIGSGIPYSLEALYDKLSFSTHNIYIKPQLIFSKKNNTGEVFSDSSKLKKSGFRFKFTIDEGLKRTVNYFKGIATS